MTIDEFATIIRDASKSAVVRYLHMCGLDSPWEVPETFMACETAKALHAEHLRVGIEFKLDRASNAPTDKDLIKAPARLQSAYSHLDLVVFRREEDPWACTLDGVVEFKKHSSLANDAALIEFMRDKKHIKYGALVLMVVGQTAGVIKDATEQLTRELCAGAWRQSVPIKGKKYQPEIPGSEVHDRYWDICCLMLK